MKYVSSLKFQLRLFLLARISWASPVRLRILCSLILDRRSMDSVDGRRPRRNSEYCNAVLRAAIIEGEVYFLTNGREGTREIQVSLFPPDRELFETQVSCTFIDSN